MLASSFGGIVSKILLKEWQTAIVQQASSQIELVINELRPRRIPSMLIECADWPAEFDPSADVP